MSGSTIHPFAGGEHVSCVAFTRIVPGGCTYRSRLRSGANAAGSHFAAGRRAHIRPPAPAATQPPAQAPTAAPTQAPTKAPTAAAPTVAPTAAAPAKDILVIGQTVDPPNLNPYETTAPYASVYANIMEPLMYIDKDANGNATFKMLLATDYKWLDSTTIQFKLRPGITFSNGEPFNADAAKFSLEQLFSAFSYTQWLQGLLKQVDIVDPMTVNVVLTKPASIVPTIIAMGGFQVPPKDFTARGQGCIQRSAHRQRSLGLQGPHQG